MKTDTWVMVADGSHGQLYSMAKKGAPLTMVKAYVHPASRVSEGGLTTDQPGRTQGSAMSSARSAMESKTSPKEVEIERFAQEIAEALDEGYGMNLFGHVILVAPPHFLGLLRKKISSSIAKLVTATLDKDYTHFDAKELHYRLAEIL